MSVEINSKWGLCELRSSFNVEVFRQISLKFQRNLRKKYCENKTMTWLIWNFCPYANKGRYPNKEASHVNVLLTPVFFLFYIY